MHQVFQTRYPLADPKPKLLALVLIDLQKESRQYFGYSHGGVDDGITRTISVIREVRSLMMPVILVGEVLRSDIIPEVLSASGEAVPVYRKRSMGALSNTDLCAFLSDSCVKTLVIGGFSIRQCVRETVEQANILGYKVMSSEQILFGGSSQAILPELREFYENNAIMFGTADGLIMAIRREIENWKRRGNWDGPGGI